ncbi:SMP-30/gluconolactonase/LRE family protein [Pseudonocardia xinjiangensis]|uniref:SMP-30/gluconolactonase/LRE family protein n=1 Tax=Pseudonocardia xinjiangensis TaxID=75289 RepID=A0ABX1RLS1_9PSEU|nr:SMP-30/gluconolactonase/LRE family protein [Pseudonocardia xinjiangensis]NMH80594.1 SMP-30/gluconolactonase/LRE family protein [Pseudonocardia xinjiangensis]
MTHAVVAGGLQFPEGPVALDDGSVLLVEIKRGTLTRVAADGSTSVVATTGGGPNGAAIGPDGAVYVCNNGGFSWSVRNGLTAPGPQPADYIGGRIQRVTLDGEVSDLYTHVDGLGLRGPNDLVFDGHGGFWFTDMGKTRERDTDLGGLYYATADGSRIVEVVHPLNAPNGVGLSPDGSRVYVAETFTGRLWCWELDGPGRVRPDPGSAARHGGTLLHAFPGMLGLDSLAVDAEGNVCVATLYANCVSVVSPEGALVETVPVPEADLFVTNICFGGPDLRTAYITSSGRGILYSTPWPRPGLALSYTA